MEKGLGDEGFLQSKDFAQNKYQKTKHAASL
jgi:hypothetical protein